MDRRRFIYLVLDILLIIGALVNVAMIDGGKWLRMVVGYYEPMQTVTQEDGEPGSQRVSDCVIVPMPGIEEWIYANALLAATDDCAGVPAQ